MHQKPFKSISGMGGGGGEWQDRVKGCHLTAEYDYGREWGAVHFGRFMFPVILNT